MSTPIRNVSLEPRSAHALASSDQPRLADASGASVGKDGGSGCLSNRPLECHGEGKLEKLELLSRSSELVGDCIDLTDRRTSVARSLAALK